MAAAVNIERWTQGVDVKEMLSGAGGLALTSMVPQLIVRDTTTGVNKLIRVAVSIGMAVVGGMALKAVAGAPAGKAAFIGGIAGTAIQTINMLRPGTIAGSTVRQLSGRTMGETLNVAPPFSREQEQVQLIRP